MAGSSQVEPGHDEYRMSAHNDDRHFSVTARDNDRNLRAVALQQDVGHTVSRLQPAQVELVEKIGEGRPFEPDLVPALIESQTETGLN